MHDPAELPAATTLAIDRTRLAHERTLMAWVRTATSMITFGFTIYKFFEEEHLHGTVPATRMRFGARDFAILMIGIALVMLVLATFQHHQEMGELRRQFGGVVIPRSLSVVLAVLIGGLGVLTLIVVALRA